MSQTDATEMKQDTLRQETADINALRWGKAWGVQRSGRKKVCMERNEGGGHRRT